MLIEVKRTACGSTSTLGIMSIDGEMTCHTLEDVVRDEKIYGETAIPAGRYRVIVNFSNRFQRDMPLLVDVPGYTGVRIHTGNTDKDTHGCILVGSAVGADGNTVTGSRLAFDRVFPQIRDAVEHGEVWLEIK